MMQKVKEKHFRKQSLLIFLFILVLFVIISLFTSKYTSSKEIIANKNIQAKILPSQMLKPTPLQKPTLTATPKITPSPTPVANVGYCLTVPVLFYHHVEPLNQAKTEGHAQLTVDSDIFDQQMSYLSSHGYTTYSAEQIVDTLLSHSTLTGKPVVVTLDDGYSDAYQFAYPIAKKYGIKLSLFIPSGLLENPGYMSWANLKEMVTSGMVFGYDHTWSHFSLPQGTYDKQENEIMTARKQLEEHLGNPNLILAYPYGAVNGITVSILQKNGFKGAFTTIPSFLQCNGNIYGLHRNRIGNAPLSFYGL